MNQVKIGEFLRELRKGKGLTQEQLAEQFNISRRSVSRWETGSNMPDVGLLIEIADFFDVDIREIIHVDVKARIEEDLNFQFDGAINSNLSNRSRIFGSCFFYAQNKEIQKFASNRL